MRAGVSIVLSRVNDKIVPMSIGNFESGLSFRSMPRFKLFSRPVLRFYVPTWIIWLLVIITPVIAFYVAEKGFYTYIDHYMPEPVHQQILN